MYPTPIREDIKAESVRSAAKTEKNARVCRRLLGIAHLLETGDRQGAQKIAGLTVNIFRTWIKRFNEQGIEGLRSKKSPGRPLKLSAEIAQKLKEKVLRGPTPEEKLVRYRLVDLQAFLKEEYNISIESSGLWRVLQRMDVTWKTGRQRHPKSNSQVQETFKKI